jgi:hypothetical protein
MPCARAGSAANSVAAINQGLIDNERSEKNRLTAFLRVQNIRLQRDTPIPHHGLVMVKEP